MPKIELELTEEQVKTLLPQMQSWIERQQVVSDVYLSEPKKDEQFFYVLPHGTVAYRNWRGCYEEVAIFNSQIITRTREGRERIRAKQNAYVELVRLCLQAGGALEWSEKYRYSPIINSHTTDWCSLQSGNFFFKTKEQALSFGSTSLHLLNIYYGREK